MVARRLSVLNECSPLGPAVDPAHHLSHSQLIVRDFRNFRQCLRKVPDGCHSTDVNDDRPLRPDDDEA